MMRYNIYTDGSCDLFSMHREGGYAYTIYNQDMSKMIRGFSNGVVDTTNNRMELMAIIEACKAIEDGASVRVFSDSRYAINVLSGKWNPSANIDLVMEHRKANAHRLKIMYVWVKGHAGNPYNEEADRLAASAQEMVKLRVNGSEIPISLKRWEHLDIDSPSDIGKKEIHWIGSPRNVFEGNHNEFIENSDRYIAIIDAIPGNGKRRNTCAFSVCLRDKIAFHRSYASIECPTENRLLLTSLHRCLGTFQAGSDIHLYTASDYVRDVMTGKCRIKSNVDIITPIMGLIENLGKITFRTIDEDNEDFLMVHKEALGQSH